MTETEPSQRRTGAKVRRCSRPWQWAASFCRHVAKEAMKRMLDALAWYADRLPRRRGQGYGEISPKMMRVYRELLAIAVKPGGDILTPAYSQIAYKARCCRGTVGRALAVLERHGFLERLRRVRPRAAGDGRWEQDTNAYRLMTPPAAERLVNAPHLGLDMRAVPRPWPPRERCRPIPPLPQAQVDFQAAFLAGFEAAQVQSTAVSRIP